MIKDNDFKVSDSKVLEMKEVEEKKGGYFSPSFSAQQLIDLMGWDKVPKLAKKSYTYDMRKVLGQLTPKEKKFANKREERELQVKRGYAKINELMERALCQTQK